MDSAIDLVRALAWPMASVAMAWAVPTYYWLRNRHIRAYTPYSPDDQERGA
jgi:hypothetical protein